MHSEPEKLDLRSPDIADDKRQELLSLFPEVRTEGGKIDFERLKAALGEMVDVGRERYGMNWPGKADCMRTIQAPSMATLLPCPDESVNFDTTENLIIEGDNLEVLKLLQKSYLGKVKMIYIDPPYNTGNDFIYPDNYSESLSTYLEYTGQTDETGRRFGTNADTDGRFHSKWLNMMYPRLYLARNLLRDDGAIFVSIDDTELHNLRQLLNEVFGEDNFIADFAWEKRTTRENRRVFSFNHEHILCVARNKLGFEAARHLLPRSEEADARFNNPDNDPRGIWQSVSLTAQAGHATRSQFYTVTTPSGRAISLPSGSCWRFTEARFAELLADGRIWFGPEGSNVPRRKLFKTEAPDGLTPETLWKAEHVGTNDSAKKALAELFPGFAVFDTPKPVELICRMLEITTDKDSLILDFFAGSGCTGHATVKINEQDGGDRKYILVQLPEPTQSMLPDGTFDDSEASKAGYTTIADITKERVRRVIAKLNDEDEGKLDLSEDSKQDRGFRVFKLAESNFKSWNAESPHDAAELSKQLELHINHIREGRSSDDLLYEILLKSGFQITTPIQRIDVSGKTVFSIAEGSLIICLERALTLELIRAIAEMKPERVVCLDEGFAGNDQLKANAVQSFKTQGITSFKTV